MTENNILPPISQATKERLRSYGFTNHLYDYLQLPSFFIPRGSGFDAYTYLVMGLSIVGGAIAKKYDIVRMPFMVSFVAAPFSAFYMKKEADFNLTSELSKRDPKLTLQNYPNLNKAFQQVNAEVDAEIAELESRIRSLEGSQSRQA